MFNHSGTDDSRVKALFDAATWGAALHDAKLKDDVTKAFAKFDKDSSGEIDREELG